MAHQIFDLGAPTEIRSDRISWSGIALAVDDVLTSSSPSYLVHVRIRTTYRVNYGFGADPNETAFVSGPDLTDAVENNGTLRIHIDDWILDAEQIGNTDPNEPYIHDFIGSDQSIINEIIFAYNTDTPPTSNRLIIWDGAGQNPFIISDEVSLSGAAQISAPTASGSLGVSRNISLSGTAQISVPTVVGRLNVSRGISLSGVAQVLSPTTSGNLGVSKSILISGSVQVSIPSVNGEVSANIAPVIPSKENPFRVRYSGGLKERTFSHIPIFYNDSETMNDLYDAIIPELEMLAEYLVTPDVRQNNIDEEIQFEIDNYLENKMGWGFERLIQQYFILGVNHFLEQTVQLYSTSLEDDYINLRNRLLLYSSINRNNNEFEIRREFEFIGRDVINDIQIDHANYSISILLNAINNDQLLAIAQRQFIEIFPAHWDIEFSSSQSMTLDDMPKRTLNDLIKRSVS